MNRKIGSRTNDKCGKRIFVKSNDRNSVQFCRGNFVEFINKNVLTQLQTVTTLHDTIFHEPFSTILFNGFLLNDHTTKPKPCCVRFHTINSKPSKLIFGPISRFFFIGRRARNGSTLQRTGTGMGGCHVPVTSGARRSKSSCAIDERVDSTLSTTQLDFELLVARFYDWMA